MCYNRYMKNLEHLYIHVPFCNSICNYCDFKRCIYTEKYSELWLENVIDDLKKSKLDNCSLKTIYLGGGTPTSLNIKQLEKLLDQINCYNFDNDFEYTIETNLENIDYSLIELLKKYGINRISLGVQSYDDDILKLINRKHSSKMISEKLQLLVDNGIENISIDLIYGFKEQSIDSWKKTLELASTDLRIKHISIYSLTIEPNSIFGKQNYEMVDNDIEAEMYEIGISILEKNGFNQYEVANFCREKYESKHNLSYWHYDDFKGIGVGASGKENHIRYNIVGSIQEYCKCGPKKEEILLTKNDEIIEFIMMNLRLREGLSIYKFNTVFSANFISLFDNLLDDLEKDDWIIMKNNHVIPTKKGLFFLHDLIIKFMEEIEND